MFDHPIFKRASATLVLQAFGLSKIPLLFFVRPRVLRNDADGCEILIPFRRRNKNHLGSMYFGAVAIGADCAAAFGAFMAIRRSGEPVSLIFKDFRAEFLKRVEGDCHLRCDQNQALESLVAQAISSGQRVEREIEVIVTVPSKEGDTPVARCWLTISLKHKAGQSR